MITKHINAVDEGSELIFLAQSSSGKTMLYDYNKEQFVVVEGFLSIAPCICVYNLDSEQRVYSLVEAYRIWQ